LAGIFAGSLKPYFLGEKGGREGGREGAKEGGREGGTDMSVQAEYENVA